jgi:hypothetical protein
LIRPFGGGAAQLAWGFVELENCSGLVREQDGDVDMVRAEDFLWAQSEECNENSRATHPCWRFEWINANQLRADNAVLLKRVSNSLSEIDGTLQVEACFIQQKILQPLSYLNADLEHRPWISSMHGLV